MIDKAQLEKEINKIKDNDVKLYSFLYDLIYQEKVEDLKFLEQILSCFILDERDEIKRISLFGLLFALKLKNQKYKEIVINFVKDEEIDFELRLTALSGLSEAYSDTLDYELISLFYQFYINEHLDDETRTQSFIGMLKILGLKSTEIIEINDNNLIVALSDIKFDYFKNEIVRVERLLNIV